MSKVVLITGGSSGIGKAIGEFLFHKGFTVYGTSRNPEKITNSVFPLIALDVRSKESIQHAVDKVISISKRIDVELAKLKKIMDEKIPEFNKMVDDAKIPAVNIQDQ